MGNSTLRHLLPWKPQAVQVQGAEHDLLFCALSGPRSRQTTYQKALALLQYSKTKSRTRAEVAGTVAGVEFS